MQWSYGITTCRDRINRGITSKTRAELSKAGFTDPKLFVDKNYGVAGNWILGLWKLYLLKPMADRFVIFQDDIVCCRNIRQYLEFVPFPERGYWNLYTSRSNSAVQLVPGFQRASQLGKGALGLVFNRDGVRTLLSSQKIVDKPLEAKRPTTSIDGSICLALKDKGFSEYIHNPSLIQHGDYDSTIGNAREGRNSELFCGEEFDARDLKELLLVKGAI